MARGQRGGRGRPQQSSRGGGANLPGRRSRKRKAGTAKGPRDELPTAAPGASQAPASAGSSVFGGSVAVPTSAAVQRPQQRRRGGPRQRAEGRYGRRAGAVHDFRYIAPDMRWIAMTTITSVALVLIFWIVLRA